MTKRLFILLAFLLLAFSVPAQKHSGASHQKTSRQAVKPELIRPQFPGGDSALSKFLNDSLRYPIAAKQAMIQGWVHIRLTIDEKGNIQNIHIVKDIGAGCGNEAIRVIKSMPRWIPAHVGNKNVPYVFELPVRFTLNEK